MDTTTLHRTIRCPKCQSLGQFAEGGMIILRHNKPCCANCFEPLNERSHFELPALGSIDHIVMSFGRQGLFSIASMSVEGSTNILVMQRCSGQDNLQATCRIEWEYFKKPFGSLKYARDWAEVKTGFSCQLPKVIDQACRIIISSDDDASPSSGEQMNFVGASLKGDRKTIQFVRCVMDTSHPESQCPVLRVRIEIAWTVPEAETQLFYPVFHHRWINGEVAVGGGSLYTETLNSAMAAMQSHLSALPGVDYDARLFSNLATMKQDLAAKGNDCSRHLYVVAVKVNIALLTRALAHDLQTLPEPPNARKRNALFSDWLEAKLRLSDDAHWVNTLWWQNVREIPLGTNLRKLFCSLPSDNFSLQLITIERSRTERE